MKKLSLVICVFNEEPNIAPLSGQIKVALKDYDFEAIFVDDGSTDGTREAIRNIKDDRFILVELMQNYGQSSALQAGIDQAGGEFIALIDGDLQNDPHDIPAMLKMAEEGAWDMVAGVRANRKDGMFLRKIPSKIANYIIRQSTGIYMKDLGCTLKVFTRDIIKSIHIYGELHRFIPVLVTLEGAFHDVVNVIRKYGIVPEETYRGLNYGEEKHVHGEMDKVLLQQVNAVVENNNKKLSTSWHDVLEGTLNAYLGELPQKFTYKGKEYSPLTFASQFVGLNLDNYVELTSYTHHPFYSKFILEIPDNWSWDELYNVPLNELEQIIDYSLDRGITIAWAADVSEKGFSTSNKGVAVLPDLKIKEMANAEIAKWETMTEKQKEELIYRLDKPVKEMKVSQEDRQIAFDNYQTTDDHGMQIFGKATDQEGNVFYKVKNSWGDYNKYKGFFYASKPYVQYKTMSIMVHRDGIPPEIRKKLKL